ncbi:peptidase C15 [Ancylobacter sp. A5.8]|uniref:pyroglutamyl-peptidase I family protein n=1 Tax=Ancylobacter gelatini TaxID=2919920 RepID=UPI001F4E880A|nr:peptidase C15 [Ancylobacter gelatini]MCJ8143774.1 peptidase C15 [Ancylobacter gelatini]
MDAIGPRILITGFGPFPGAPVNPSAALARLLVRPGKSARELLVLPTTWAQARGFGEELERRQPDIVLMIGLAARRRALCVETRAVNHAGGFPDVRRRRPASRALRRFGPREIACAAAPVPLVHALRQAGLPARVSRDAGRYICNALAFEAYGWAARDSGRLAIFVHIPSPRSALPRARMAHGMAALLKTLEAQFAARQRASRGPMAASER